MEVFVDRTGQRVFINSSYIDQSELKRNVLLYDPNGYNIGCGLYDRSMPACERWVDHFHQHEKRNCSPPQYEVDRDGRTIYPANRFSPNWPPYLPSPYRQ